MSAQPNSRAHRASNLVLAAVGLLVAVGMTTPAAASDHNEPQSLNSLREDVSPRAGDIYGNFAWATDDSVVFALTFPAPPFGFDYLDAPPPEEPFDETHPNAYDDGVVYRIHIDRDIGGLVSRNLLDDEITLSVRFGYDEEKEVWGYEISGLPDQPMMVERVNRTITTDRGTHIKAGLFDEPFFFDLERFFVGLKTGDLDFRKDVDFFAGRNVHGVVIEMPKHLLDGWFVNQLSVWTTAERLAGDPHIRPDNACAPQGDSQ